MAKRSKKRIVIVETRQVEPPGIDPVEAPQPDYVEAQSAARAPTPREIVAEEIRQRREAVARSMAEAQSEVTAAVDRAAYDLERLPAPDLMASSPMPTPPAPAVTTAAEAVAEAMQAANRAVEAAGLAVASTEGLLGADLVAVDQVLVEAMRAADRSVADSLRGGTDGIAAAAEGAAPDIAGE